MFPFAFRGHPVVSRLPALWLAMACSMQAQGPSPETGATLFPGGALLSYGSVLSLGSAESRPGDSIRHLRPTFRHEMLLTFSWGITRDYQLIVVSPVLDSSLRLAESGSGPSGTGLGDLRLLLKHRFLRSDSERGTTQVAATFGPEFPTGRTGLRDRDGALLPVHLQPGSGSIDWFAGVNATYTGLFNIRRLVADGSVKTLFRGKGNQEAALGNESEMRLWISYRPYQTRTLGREWFVGPALTWRHRGQDEQGDSPISRTGGELLTGGLTSYFSPGPGLHLWIGLEFPLFQDPNDAPVRTDRIISFGMTKQFLLPHW